MGFFKDFKEDMKQAVNELIPGNDEVADAYDDEDMINTFDEDPAVQEAPAEPEPAAPADDFDVEIAEEDLMEPVEEPTVSDVDDVLAELRNTINDNESSMPEASSADDITELLESIKPEHSEAEVDYDPSIFNETLSQVKDEITEPQEEAAQEAEESAQEEVAEEPSLEEAFAEALAEKAKAEEEVPEEPQPEATEEEKAETEEAVEEAKQEETPVEEKDKVIEISSVVETEPEKPEMVPPSEEEVSDSTTYVTKGARINGNLFTDGSLDILGTIEGDVNCYGKLIISGVINGKVSAGEIYANAAKINGEVVSAGSVKIGVGSVIVGDVEAQSAVIAGAINGDLDVKGPVIVDSTAIIMGNIKSRSVQINNGAVIEGFCSQCYSEIDVKSFFE